MRKSYIEKLEQINTLYSDIKENMTNIKEYYIILINKTSLNFNNFSK